MKKKGFTLVELLAVIAILAVLVIIALPNVLGMFRKAKQGSFENELKNIYSTAQKQFASESMNTSTPVLYREYSRNSSGTCARQLDLSGRDTMEYYVKMNTAGRVVEFYATDGQYQFELTGDNIQVTDLVDSIARTDIDEDEYLKINCSGAIKSNEGYEVAYFFHNDILLTPSEYQKVKRLEGRSCSTLYIGEKTDANKYYYCWSVYFVDEQKYKEGSRVQLKTIQYKQIDTGRCSYDEATGTILCPANVEVYNGSLNHIYYDRNYPLPGFSFNDNDPEVMNFNSIYDNRWNVDNYATGYIIVRPNQSFTMPNHNVLFSDNLSLPM